MFFELLRFFEEDDEEEEVDEVGCFGSARTARRSADSLEELGLKELGFKELGFEKGCCDLAARNVVLVKLETLGFLKLRLRSVETTVEPVMLTQLLLVIPTDPSDPSGAANTG